MPTRVSRSKTTSPPARGAWIEIDYDQALKKNNASSPPARGAWIEIISLSRELHRHRRRPPRGGRGLKYELHRPDAQVSPSPPARGAWIEIPQQFLLWFRRKSPPARGAWIEMLIYRQGAGGKGVAPREGGVD